LPAPSERVHVVGMGNILYRDEGIGVYAARYLQAAYRFSPEIDLVDGATLGFGLMELFEKGSKIIVLDALMTEAPPGTMYRLSRKQLLDLGPSMQPTAHEVEPLELLKLAEVLGEPPDMVLMGIVPADAQTMAVGLTPELEAAFPAYVDAITSEIRASGVEVDLVRQMSVDDVVESLVTRA
jgi:hydrogenase maturation protease